MENLIEYKSLATSELIISNNNNLIGLSLLNVCIELKRIRDTKSYSEDGYTSFESYVEEKQKISRRQAYNFITVAESYTVQSIAQYQNFGINKLVQLSQIEDDNKRIQFVEENNVNEMTTRELREEIQKRKQLEIQNHALQETLAHVQSSKPEVIEKEVIKEVFKEVIPDDYEEFKRKYESKSLLEKQIKTLEEEIYKKDTKILSLQIAQKEAVNKLPQTEKEKKLLDDSLSFIWAVNDFLKKVGGLVYLTQQISDLPTHERNRYISAIENVWGWSNQTKFNLEEEIKNEWSN